MPVNVSFSVGFSLVQQVHFSLFQDFFPPRSYPPPSRFFKREIPPLSSSRPFFSRLKKIIYKSSHLSSPFPNPHLSLNKRSSVPLDLPYNLFAPGERQPTSLLARLDQQQLYFFAKNLVVHLSAEYESIFYRFKEFCEFTLSWLKAFYFWFDQIFLRFFATKRSTMNGSLKENRLSLFISHLIGFNVRSLNYRSSLTFFMTSNDDIFSCGRSVARQRLRPTRVL